MLAGLPFTKAFWAHVWEMLAGLQFQAFLPHTSAANAGMAADSRSLLGTCDGNAHRIAHSRHSCYTHLLQMLAGLSIPEAFWAHGLDMLAGLHIPEAFWAHVQEMLAGWHISDIPETHICCKCWQGSRFQKLSGSMCCKCWQGCTSRHPCHTHILSLIHI